MVTPSPCREGQEVGRTRRPFQHQPNQELPDLRNRQRNQVDLFFFNATSAAFGFAGAWLGRAGESLEPEVPGGDARGGGSLGRAGASLEATGAWLGGAGESLDGAGASPDGADPALGATGAALDGGGAAFGVADVAIRVRNAAKTARANMTMVICLYHECQVRPSPWSSPHSPLANSKHSSTAHRDPATRAKSATVASTGPWTK